MALHTIRSAGEIEVTSLLTTVNAVADRVSMHAVRHTLLRAQANALGLPLEVVELPQPCDNEVYERQMAVALATAVAEDTQHMIFGDLFLDDVRTYREQQLAATGVTPLFPLWRRPTDVVAADIIACGIRAVITCVDPAQAPADLAGRWYDHDLLADLPAGVDPCGENGEFHTFVVAGPGFAHPLNVQVGEVIERGGFIFADIQTVA